MANIANHVIDIPILAAAAIFAAVVASHSLAATVSAIFEHDAGATSTTLVFGMSSHRLPLLLPAKRGLVLDPSRFVCDCPPEAFFDVADYLFGCFIGGGRDIIAPPLKTDAIAFREAGSPVSTPTKFC